MSTTSDRPRRPLGLSPSTWALVVAIVLGMVGAGIAVGLALRDRDDARQDADAVAGQSRQLVECVRDPATDDCTEEAKQVESTIGDVKAGDPGRAGADGTDGVDGQDGADGATGPRGPQGPRGPRGFIGPVGPAGVDGTDGTAGTDGAAGTAGETGPTGPQGPAGDRGPTGDTGPAGPPGTALPGTYTCPDDEYLHGVTVADDGAVTLDCLPAPPLIEGLP
jgi:hypothetical protein